MNSTIISKAINFVDEYFNTQHDPGLQFHDRNHTKAVAHAVNELCKLADLSEEEKSNIRLAAWFHDLGYTTNPDNHEFESATIAEKYLQSEGLSQEKIDIVKKLILATKLEWSGQDYHSLLLRDADLAYLASDNFFEISDKLRSENKYRKGEGVNDTDWINSNIAFLDAYNYKTKEGKMLFEKNKARNLYKLKSMLMSNNEQEVVFDNTALAHFETTLRNHIELSAIADNKANIMLTVNVIISTVGLPIMFNILRSHEHFLVPIIILSATSLISIIYATLCTRPIKMNGYTDLAKIPAKQSNLFFFGNYFKMTFADYEKGIVQTISDKELFENVITRNLYDLGISLGKKYIQLRYSYNIFMIGIIMTIISFITVLAFN